jgi:hypothetical protein
VHCPRCGAQVLKANEDGEWSASAPPPYPHDAVIDHLLVCVHGEAMTEAGLKSCVDSMRRNSEHVAKRYMEERPMLMAVDAIDWREVGT